MSTKVYKPNEIIINEDGRIYFEVSKEDLELFKGKKFVVEDGDELAFFLDE